MIVMRMFVNDYNDLNSIWQISLTPTPCNLMSNLTFLGKEFSMVIQYFVVTTWQNGVLHRSTIYPNLQCTTAAYVHRLLLQVLCVCLCMCVYMNVFVTLNSQRIRIAFPGCIWCGCQRNSLKLRIATFCSLCKHGITAWVGA